MKPLAKIFLLWMLGVLSLLPSLCIDAQVLSPPALMNFQGRLARPDGTPVADGTYSIRFSLWDAVTGGAEKWNQTLNNIAVVNGVFDVLLNVGSAGLFDGNLHLEIKIGTDAPLTPRQQLVSVAYAMKANTVPDGSITSAKIATGTITADRFAPNILNPLTWLLGGNSGTNPATHFLGTTDNQPLVFRANNIERLRLTPTGHLGIGTNNPASALHVAQATGLTIGVSPASGGYTALLLSLSEPSGGNAQIQAIKSAGTAYGDLILNPSAGNVGIGTTAPASKLHVNGTAQMTGFKLTTGAGTGRVLASDASGVGTWGQAGTAGIADNAITTAKILDGTVGGADLALNSVTNEHIASVDWSKITNAPPSGGWQVTGNSGTDPATQFLGTTDAKALVFRTNNAARMTVGATGNVGIGITNPQYLLDVVGQVPNGAVALDQSQATTNATGGLNTVTVWQSFTAGATGLLSHVELNLSSVYDYKATPGSMSIIQGEGLGPITLDGQAISIPQTGFGWRTFYLTRPVLVTSGQVYTIRINMDYTTANWVAYDNRNPYAGGRSNLGADIDLMFKTHIKPVTGGRLLHIYNGYGMDVRGNLAVQGELDLGMGEIGRERSAGKIGYGIFTANALDIVGGGTTGANRIIKLWAEGGVQATGNYSNVSDGRYKTNISTFDNALNAILNLRGVTYDWDRERWKDRYFAEGKQIGFIAQEVEQILPELVSTDRNGYKSVAYANVVPVLVEAVKAQQKQITAQQAEIATLRTQQKQYEQQQAQIEELKRRLDTLLTSGR